MQLDRTNAADVAGRIGRLKGANRARVSDLSAGGVSNAVFKVESDHGCLVLKQPFAKLRVAADWHIDRVRVIREAAGMRVWSTLVDNSSCPAVLGLDESNYILAMGCAPADFVNWKSALLAGRTTMVTAEALGRRLAALQRASAGQGHLADRFPNHDTFVQGRLDPYFGSQLRSSHPESAAALADLTGQLGGRQHCLVHGDFSPKNVLVDSDGAPFLIDFEIFHYGHPAFDPAFMLSHLLLKCLHLPAAAADLAQLGRTFWRSYRRQLSGWIIADQEAVTIRCLGALLLARIDGKSPVEYITTDIDRQRVVDLGRSLLLGECNSIAAACGRTENMSVSAPNKGI